MEKTTFEIGTDYMDFIYQFHNTICEQQIVLVYEGIITQSITKAFSSMAEQKIEESVDSSKTQKRVIMLW